jgi:hypothetical protein
MAQWLKSYDGSSYWQLSAIAGANVQDYFNDGKWWIVIANVAYPGGINVRGPFVDRPTAQTALDNAIAGLGGSI